MAKYATSALKLSDTYINTLPYNLCDTAAGTAAKTVSAGEFALETGAQVVVKFKNTNTAASPTLNVSSTGAKAIYYKDAAIEASYLKANYTYTFVYNGTQWDLVGEIDTNTTYSSKTAESGGTDFSLVTTGEKYTWNNKQNAINASNKLSSDYIDNKAGWTNNTGTVTGVKLGTTSYSPTSGIISLPAYPSKSSWNYDDAYVKYSAAQSLDDTQKAQARSNIGAAAGNHTHNYLEKTTYEKSAELACGSNGLVCLGKFGAYDTNITIELNSTTSQTYHATIVIWSQNVVANGTGGSVGCYVYGDADNHITPLLSIFRPYGSASRQIEVYANLPG